MTLDTTSILYLGLSAVAIGGALTVVFTRNVTRMAIGLGAFFLAVAGFFALHLLSFLAVAQIFLYVGGVLVLFVFAIMLVHRSEDGSPGLESRHDIGSLSVAAGIFGLTVWALYDISPSLTGIPEVTSDTTLGAVLLGDMLPHFEAAGVLLLIALIAVLVIAGGDRE